jgi:hypothetical protein
MNFAASIIFPNLLELHQIFGSFLHHQRYHCTHVSYLMIDLGCCIHTVKIIDANDLLSSDEWYLAKPKPGPAHHYLLGTQSDQKDA